MGFELVSRFPPGSRRRTWALVLLFLVLAFLFLAVNRGAYRGYFSDDDLENLANAQMGQLRYYAVNLLSPLFDGENFRPTGHFVYYAMERLAQLNFPPYIALIQGIHLINTLLIWLLIRRLGATVLAASSGALFFAFELAVFDVYWKPMYVFDLLCGLFCLLAVLAYLHQRTVLAVLSFWLAYKAKEAAIMLPVVLAIYEYWFGSRRWRRLVPFFLISMTFGLQGLYANRSRDDAYTLRFSPAAIWQCIDFYSSRIFGVRGLGLALVTLPVFVRDKLFRFGFAGFCVLLLPMLLLPERLFGAYLYVPYIALSIVAAALAMRVHPAFVALFFALWLPWNQFALQDYRQVTLATDEDARTWAVAVGQFAAGHPDVRTYFYECQPNDFDVWGMLAVVRYHLSPGPPATLYSVDTPQAAHMAEAPTFALVRWDPGLHKVTILSRNAQSPDSSYIRMTEATPIWQLTEGWFPLKQYSRWIKPYASARLWRPEQAIAFQVVVNIGRGYLKEVSQAELVVRLDGKEIGRQTFSQPGWQTARWGLPEGPARPVQVEFRVTPEFRPNHDDNAIYGIAVGAFGFVTPSTDVEWPPKG